MTSIMDLLGEGDTGTRILTARHISEEKTISGINNAVNTTFLCHSYSIQPDFKTYFAALDKFAVALWVTGLTILVVICALYGVTVRTAWRHSRHAIVSVAVVLAVYPIIAASAYITTVVPRAQLLCEAVAQEVVMIAMYHFYLMVIADCGGVEKLVRRAGECRLETRVLPCCCWPCCVLPRPRLERRSLLWVRYLVLQMAVIQGIIYITLLVIWAEDMTLYQRSFIYFQPFVAASILSGLYGVNMCVRAAEGVGLRPRGKLLALQLALLIVKLQCGVIRVLPQMFALPCMMSLHPTVFVNLLQNSMTLVEMLALSVLAWRLYSGPLLKAVDKVQHAVIATVDENIFDARSIRDIEAKSFRGKGDL